MVVIAPLALGALLLVLSIPRSLPAAVVAAAHSANFPEQLFQRQPLPSFCPDKLVGTHNSAPYVLPFFLQE